MSPFYRLLIVGGAFMPLHQPLCYINIDHFTHSSPLGIPYPQMIVVATP